MGKEKEGGKLKESEVCLLHRIGMTESEHIF